MIYVNLKIETTRYPQIEYSTRNLRHVDLEKLRNDAEKYPWILIENMNCMNRMVNFITEGITAIYDNHPPIVYIKK